MPIGFLMMLLFYFDHVSRPLFMSLSLYRLMLFEKNVSSITAQAKQFPLKKPGGFHWDFFLLGCTSFIAGIIGLPLPNGLVPQVSQKRFSHN